MSGRLTHFINFLSVVHFNSPCIEINSIPLFPGEQLQKIFVTVEKWGLNIPDRCKLN